ncbi:unnamed protein product [Paramecium pentaurelia]|uniref:Uncharacterized protein n=1 Tax=Paramecium pentaurelia TaxID=43138 RepID=A0A8S1WA99_9CILI|nr:unnamed protein product [Paramecium pentaurelia]
MNIPPIYFINHYLAEKEHAPLIIAQILFVLADVVINVKQIDQGITTIVEINLGIKLIYLMDYHLDPQILTKLVGYEYDFNSKQVKISLSNLVTQEDSWQTKKGHEAFFFEPVASFEYQTRFFVLLGSIYKHQKKISHTQALSTKGPQKSRFRQSTPNKECKSKASYFSADRQYAQSKFFSGLKKRSKYLYLLGIILLLKQYIKYTHTSTTIGCKSLILHKIYTLTELVNYLSKKKQKSQILHRVITQRFYNNQGVIKIAFRPVHFSQYLAKNYPYLCLKQEQRDILMINSITYISKSFYSILNLLMQILNMLLDSPFYKTIPKQCLGSQLKKRKRKILVQSHINSIIILKKQKMKSNNEQQEDLYETFAKVKGVEERIFRIIIEIKKKKKIQDCLGFLSDNLNLIHLEQYFQQEEKFRKS